MRYRVTFIAGLAAGYVLGTRAGRERYEQIQRAVRRVADTPAVQEAAGVVQAQATGLAGATRRKVSDTVGEKLPRQLRRRTHETVHADSTTNVDGHIP